MRTIVTQTLITKLKKQAKQMAKHVPGLSHAKALDHLAKEQGYPSYTVLLQHLERSVELNATPLPNLFHDQKQRIADLVSLSTFQEQLALAEEGGLRVCYAPFDFVNRSAKVVLVGLTPGAQQAVNALRSVKEVMASGLSDDEVLQQAKRQGSFSGPMRNNLVAMLDAIGLNRKLGLATTASLFGDNVNLVHFTSVLKYPVFLNGENYSGSPDLLTTPFLKRWVDDYFLPEVAALKQAWFIPLGKDALKALDYLAQRNILPNEHILRGMPHPSGANAERIAYFLGRKSRSELSSKTNADTIDAAKRHLIDQVLGGHTPAASQSPPTETLMPVPALATPAGQTTTDPQRNDNDTHLGMHAVGKFECFLPYRNRTGKYTLYSRIKMQQTGAPIHHKENLVLVDTLDEAIRLVRSGEYHIRLRGEQTGDQNVFHPSKIVFS